jgi:hypothetical protein
VGGGGWADILGVEVWCLGGEQEDVRMRSERAGKKVLIESRLGILSRFLMRVRFFSPRSWIRSIW